MFQKLSGKEDELLQMNPSQIYLPSAKGAHFRSFSFAAWVFVHLKLLSATKDANKSAFINLQWPIVCVRYCKMFLGTRCNHNLALTVSLMRSLIFSVCERAWIKRRMTYANMVFTDVSSDLYWFSVNLWLQNGLYARRHSEKVGTVSALEKKTLHDSLKSPYNPI